MGPFVLKPRGFTSDGKLYNLYTITLYGSSEITKFKLPSGNPGCFKNVLNFFQGTGLAFIAVADAIAVMPGGPFWAVLFFMMLLTLGLGSAFGTLEGFITPMFNLLGTFFG